MIAMRCILATAFVVLSGAIATAAPGDAFRGLDQDQDGRSTLTEFYPTGPPPLHPRMRQVFESFDPEKRGSLDFETVAKVVDAVRSLQPKLDPALDGSFTEIPLQVNARSKRAFVKVSVNGVEGTFLVDTGTSDTIVDTAFARRAGIDFVEICMTITGGNYGAKGDYVALVKVPQMEIGGVHFRDFHAVMRDESKKRSDFEGQLDGILGANLLFAKPLTLDYKNARLSFSEDRTKPADFEFDLLADYPKVPVVAAQLDGTEIRLMFDSGAAIGDTLLINEPYHEALRTLAGDAEAKEYASKELRVSGKLLASGKRCLLRPFEHSVIGSVFYGGNLVTIDRQAGKIRISAQEP